MRTGLGLGVGVRFPMPNAPTTQRPITRTTTRTRTSAAPKPACRLLRKPIDVSALAASVSGKANGAVCTFVGQVRNVSRGKKVAYLEYEAYEPMALKMLTRIAQEASEKWGVQTAIEHRLGRLELGGASVVVCGGSPHRAAAFEACRWCIDTLKEEVPIWKKEVCPDGAFWIEDEEAAK